MEKRIDKYVNKECGGWKPRKTNNKYNKWRENVLKGKIILDREGKEIFKSIEKRRRDKQKIK